MSRAGGTSTSTSVSASRSRWPSSSSSPSSPSAGIPSISHLRRRSTARSSPSTITPSEGRSRSGSSSSRSPGPTTRSPRAGQESQLAPAIIERLIDTKIQAKLAAELGITATPEQIEAKIVADSTTPEERHAWIIAVKPAVDTGKTDPTDAQKAAAKAIADKALADITTGGKAWEDVAKAVSTDSTKTTGGDLGWIGKDAAEGKVFIDAVFAAEANKPTAVLVADDGTYEIGRVTDIAPPVVDTAWKQKLTDAGLDLAAYDKVIEADVIHQALIDRSIADASAADKQRHVLEISLAAPQTPPTDKAVKVRHILYSPKDDPQGAKDLDPNDPAWAAAKAEADAAYAALQKDPTQFDAMARKDSDEESARGDTGSGGKLPLVDTDGQFVKEFSDAVLKDGLKPGDILPPVKSDFGWHVIQILYRPPDLDEMNNLKAQAAAGADFATLARNYSDSSEGGKGGDRGWVAPGLIDARQLRAIFAAPVGGLSDVVEVKGVGVFLYKVPEERTQKPDAAQLETIKSQAFQDWYGEKKDAATITRELLDKLQSSQPAQ
jgi:parvulin-like peptidyl-prolyl isomerase